MPTPFEIANQVLSLFDPKHDYEPLVEKLYDNIKFSLKDSKIAIKSDYCAFSIGVGSTIVGLKEVGETEFSDRLMSFLENDLRKEVISSNFFSQIDDNVWTELLS